MAWRGQTNYIDGKWTQAGRDPAGKQGRQESGGRNMNGFGRERALWTREGST